MAADGSVRATEEVIDLRTRRAADLDSLMGSVANGDHQAFADLFEHLATRVHGRVRSVVIDEALAEEETQEVMLEVWRKAARYSPQLGSAASWTLTIARRRAIDRVRREQAGRWREARYGSHGSRPPEPDVEDVVTDAMHRDDLVAMIRHLCPEQRECIEQAFVFGYSHSEVSLLLDLPLGTVKSRIRAGLAQLRVLMEEGT